MFILCIYTKPNNLWGSTYGEMCKNDEDVYEYADKKSRVSYL